MLSRRHAVQSSPSTCKASGPVKVHHTGKQDTSLTTPFSRICSLLQKRKKFFLSISLLFPLFETNCQGKGESSGSRK